MHAGGRFGTSVARLRGQVFLGVCGTGIHAAILDGVLCSFLGGFASVHAVMVSAE